MLTLVAAYVIIYIEDEERKSSQKENNETGRDLREKVGTL